MNRGIVYSLVLHGVMVLLLIFGLPSWFRTPDPQVSAISVELLPMSELSNVKKKTPKPKKEPPKPIEKSKPVPKQAEAPKEEPVKPEPKPEPDPVKPEPVKPEIKEPEPKKPEPKKKEKPKEKPKKKEKPSELDSLLKDLDTPNDSEDTDEKKVKPQTQQEEPVEENTKSDSDSYNDAMPLSMNEQDAIRSQVEKRWSPPAGAKDSGKMQVVLRVKVQEDGTVTAVSIEKSSSGFGADAAVSRAFDESAVRAVKMSSPLQNLPADKYDNWKDFTFTFTPEGLS